MKDEERIKNYYVMEDEAINLVDFIKKREDDFVLGIVLDEKQMKSSFKLWLRKFKNDIDKKAKEKERKRCVYNLKAFEEIGINLRTVIGFIETNKCMPSELDLKRRKRSE